MWEILLPIIGFLIGVISVMVGLGGGFLFVPLMTLAYGVLPANAAGSSLTAIFMTTAVASAYFSRQKRTYYRTGLILSAASVPGAWFGSYLTVAVPEQVIGILFAVALVFTAWQMIYPKNTVAACDEDKEPDHAFLEKEILSKRRRPLLLAAFLCFFAGLCGGLLGVPGVLLVPIMALVLRMPLKAVAATSVFTMVFVSFVGAAQHVALGYVNVDYALLIGSGSMVGGLLGVYFCKIAANQKLRWVFTVLLVLIGLEMFLKYGFGF